MKTYLKLATGASLSLMMAGSALAATTPQWVANTTQLGSLIVFPDIDTRRDDENNKDTIIRLMNTQTNPGTERVHLVCEWMNASKHHKNFDFYLSPHEAVYFSAKTGLGNFYSSPGAASPFDTDLDPDLGYWAGQFPKFADVYQGTLTCFATTANSKNLVAYNYLAGSALVVDYDDGTAYEYNSWNFRAVDDLTVDPPKAPRVNQVIGKSKNGLNLDGVQYDACPRYLWGNFSPAEDWVEPRTGAVISGYPGALAPYTDDTFVVIYGCKQDFRQDFRHYWTKLHFNIWNANEVSRSGAYHCIDSYGKFKLDDYAEGNGDPGILIDYNGSNFTYPGLGRTVTGLFQVEGIASNECVENGYLPPWVGNDETVVTEKVGIVGVMIRDLKNPRIEESVDLRTAVELNSEGESETKAADKIWFYPW